MVPLARFRPGYDQVSQQKAHFMPEHQIACLMLVHDWAEVASCPSGSLGKAASAKTAVGRAASMFGHSSCENVADIQ